MRELKADQSVRTTQVQPGLKKSTPQTVEDRVERHEAIELEPALNSETALSLQEATSKRGSKTAKQTASKTKRSTTSKAKQIASTQVKLTWEVPESSERNAFGITVRFQQLERELTQLKSQADEINQQSAEIQTEMESLRTIAQQSALAAPKVTHRLPYSKTAEPSIPSFMQSPTRHQTASPQPSIPQPPAQQSVQPLTRQQTVSSQSFTPQPPVSQKPFADSTSATLKSLKNPAPSRRRRRSLRHSLHRLMPSLELPKKPIVRFVDALLWTLAAAGLRIGLSFLIGAIPFLAMPIGLLMFVPAIAAAYLAFFVPQSSPALLYRLLLVTLGLFIGGKL